MVRLIDFVLFKSDEEKIGSVRDFFDEGREKFDEELKMKRMEFKKSKERDKKIVKGVEIKKSREKRRLNRKKRFKDLSSEIQFIIFEQVDEPLDVFCCALVCRYWRVVFMKELGYFESVAKLRHGSYGDPFLVELVGNPFHGVLQKRKKRRRKKLKDPQYKKVHSTKGSFRDREREEVQQLRKELKQVKEKYQREKKTHEQSNRLYNEHIDRLQMKMAESRRRNNQLMSHISSLNNTLTLQHRRIIHAETQLRLYNEQFESDQHFKNH